MPRLLLVTSTTGYQAAAFREAAARLEILLALASDRCHQLEDPWRDGALAVRFEQPEESARVIAEFAAKNALDAIVALGELPPLPPPTPRRCSICNFIRRRAHKQHEANF